MPSCDCNRRARSERFGRFVRPTPPPHQSSAALARHSLPASTSDALTSAISRSNAMKSSFSYTGSNFATAQHWRARMDRRRQLTEVGTGFRGIARRYRREMTDCGQKLKVPPFNFLVSQKGYAANGWVAGGRIRECSISASIFLPRKSIRTFTRSLAGKACVTQTSSPAKAPSAIRTLSPCESL
jgi:hypothetical protein